MSTLMKRRGTWLMTLGVATALSLGAVACGDDDDNPAPTSGAGATATEDNGNSELDYSSMSGNVDIDGSSTVFPITVIAAEEFSLVSDVRVNVALSGTGGGFEKFCRGDTDASNASRPIKESEVDACAKEGIDDIVELQVAIDALTIVTNPGNDWAQCLTTEQVVDIFREGGASKWSDLDPSWPDANIVKYYPGADSGTFDYFTEVLEGVDESYVHSSSGTSSEDDNVLVIGVEGDKNAIGYFGLSYYVEAGQELNAVDVDGGNGCVAPTAASAQSGEYAPYSRPLFIYTRESFLEEREEVLGFLNFYFENLDEFVEETGYATMSADQKAEQYAKIEAFLP